jgi:branched-chain amino acid transport system substrate-binding protein
MQSFPIHLRRAATIAALPLLLLSACGGEGGEVVFGLAGPFNQPNGRSMRLSAEMAVQEINAQGGIRIRLEIRDDERSETRGVQVARELRAKPEVAAVIGHLNSGVSLKTAEVYNAAKGEGDLEGGPVVQISPASSAPELTQAGEWTFRVTPTDLEFSPALAQFARGRLGRSRAAVLYVNDDYGRGVMSTFQAAFRRQGGTVVSADPYVPAVIADDASLDPFLVRALRERGADALVIGGQADQGIRIVRAARRLGYTGPILGSDGMTGVKDMGPVAEGVYVSSAFLPDREDPRARDFVRRYQERYRELPDHRGAMTYDIVHLLAAAVQSEGADRVAIRRYLETVGRAGGRPAFEGVSGNIAFDANGDVVNKPVAVGQVRGGRLVTAR